MKPGATGQYPEGKLVPHDEGELTLAVFSKDGHVIMEYGTPVRWFAAPPQLARQLAALLLKHADDVETNATTDAH